MKLGYSKIMLSVLIEARDEPILLSATLSALVPGAVEGLVADVVVVDRGMGVSALRVAEDAGCQVRTETLSECLTMAKCDWVMLLECGSKPLRGWVDAVSHFLGDAAEGAANRQAARFRVARQDRSSLWQGLRLRRNLLSGGLILRKRDGVAFARSVGEPAGLVRLARPQLLDADIRIRPAQGEPKLPQRLSQ
ncbi:glycosyl transferase [Aureimonas fodinaquatilis]|uniref:Glycosyl transferase n=1 Tax=Aureimonas fodinaquatilis TaxID=2565783 RepID=A0A5B0E052_9HYPH|nr:glycosyl transferase [Aureimonas fodinaquatilis]KAA0972444.1 glycosyl transferase [Aureimonas fodinaquatilis]